MKKCLLLLMVSFGVVFLVTGTSYAKPPDNSRFYGIYSPSSPTGPCVHFSIYHIGNDETIVPAGVQYLYIPLEGKSFSYSYTIQGNTIFDSTMTIDKNIIEISIVYTKIDGSGRTWTSSFQVIFSKDYSSYSGRGYSSYSGGGYSGDDEPIECMGEFLLSGQRLYHLEN